MQVKGRVFKVSFAFLERKFGKEKTAKFLSDNPAFSEMVNYSEVDWYPIEQFSLLCEKIDKYFGFGDGSIMVEAGSYSAAESLKTSHKLFSGMSVRSLIQNAQAIYASYYSDSNVKVEEIEEKKLKIVFDNLPCDMFLSKRLKGWLKTLLSQTGAKNITLSESLKTCPIFTIKWE